MHAHYETEGNGFLIGLDRLIIDGWGFSMVVGI
jgi:hypothetical protein